MRIKISARGTKYKVGMIFGYLKIIDEASGRRARCGMAKTYVKIKCSLCNSEKEMHTLTLKRAKSCGCKKHLSIKKELTKELILKNFDYNKENGTLCWKNIPQRNRKNVIGKEGWIKNGYKEVHFNRKVWRVHRLIWFLEYNYLPNIIDHINGDTTDNRIENLRAASARTNSQNKKIHREGRLLGAQFRPDMNKWVSRIQVNGKGKHLGTFTTEIEAHQAYLNALRFYGLQYIGDL